MLVSIVIPAFNEEAVIGPHLDAILRHCGPKSWDFEVIVVDDGSSDRTPQIVEGVAAEHDNARLIRLPRNRGKGYAVRTGLADGKGDVRGFTDADASTPISELDRVLPVIENGASAVIGSRAKPSEDTLVVAKWHRKFIGRVFNGLLRMLLNLKDADGRGLADTQCGFKWFSSEVCDAILPVASLDGFAFDVELLHLVNAFGFRVVELPVNWADHGKSSVNLLMDPPKMLYRAATVRWLHRGVSRKPDA